jgi:lysophospholipase L1-like esterase
MQKRLFADFLLALTLLLAAELGVRLFLPHDVSGRFSYGYDQDSGFVEPGDGTVHLVRAGGRRFHPQIFSLRRPADTCRIMVIGDSVPRGPSLPAAYAGQLQEVLKARGIRAEVINLALPGFGARRSQLVLKKVLEYDPSLIILHLNDSNEYEDEREYRRCQDFQGWHPKHWLMKVFIFARAYEIKTEKVLWKLLPDTIRRQTALNDADAEVQASLDQAQQTLWQERVWQTTGETVALARQKGIPVVLVTQGTLQPEETGQMRIDDHGLDALANSLEGPGVNVLSMQQVFSALTPFKPYFADSAHLTTAGHQIMARELADLLRCEVKSARWKVHSGK